MLPQLKKETYLGHKRVLQGVIVSFGESNEHFLINRVTPKAICLPAYQPARYHKRILWVEVAKSDIYSICALVHKYLD